MKKRKIIVTVVSLILVCAMVATCLVALLTNTSPAEDETQGQTNETTDSTNTESSSTSAEGTEDIVVPPIEESTEKPPVDKPLLDVGDMVSDPNPSVVDSKIEYGTKEVDNNAE